MIELLSESRVAAMVFEGGAPEPPPPSSPSSVLLLDYSHEARTETLRLLQQRRLMASHHAATRGGAALPVLMMRVRSLEPGLVLVFELTFAGLDADAEEREVIAIHLKTGGLRWRLSFRDFRDRLGRMLPAFAAAAAPTVERLLQERSRRLQPVFEVARRRTSGREEELRVLDRSAARRLVQRGLFERGARPATPVDHTDDRGGAAEDSPGSEATSLSASSELLAVLVAVHR